MKTDRAIAPVRLHFSLLIYGLTSGSHKAEVKAMIQFVSIVSGDYDTSLRHYHRPQPSVRQGYDCDIVGIIPEKGLYAVRIYRPHLIIHRIVPIPYPPETSEKNPTTSPSLSSRLNLACSPFTLTRSSFAFTGLHFIILRTSPTVLPSGSFIQDRSSSALLSQPRGGKTLTFIWDHHEDAFHRAAFGT